MKKISKTPEAGDNWLQSELLALAGSMATVGVIAGALLCATLKPSYTEGYNEARKDAQERVDEYFEDSQNAYAKGKRHERYDAAQAGTGRYEIDPQSGEINFKWLKACDCKEGCKCSEK